MPSVQDLESNSRGLSSDFLLGEEVTLMKMLRSLHEVHLSPPTPTSEIDVSVVVLVRRAEHGVQFVVGGRLSHLYHHRLQLVHLDETIAV